VYSSSSWLLGKTSGGAEKQVGLLAQGLARRGHDVTLVAFEHSGPPENAGGVTIRAAWDVSRGRRLVRAITYRVPCLRRVLAEIDAHVYYARGAQAYSRWIVDAAHSVDSPALLGLASDRDLQWESGLMMAPGADSPIGRATGYAAWALLQRRALRAADAVIVQNTAQAERCEHAGLPHVLIPSIVPKPSEALQEIAVDNDVVWAANVPGLMRRGKSVHAVTELAEALPRVRFAVIGSLPDPVLAADIANLRRLPNVTVLGSLAFEDMQVWLARSRIVLSTSSVEGFSNVMLEGWALGGPAAWPIAFGWWPPRTHVGCELDLACPSGARAASFCACTGARSARDECRFYLCGCVPAPRTPAFGGRWPRCLSVSRGHCVRTASLRTAEGLLHAGSVRSDAGLCLGIRS